MSVEQSQSGEKRSPQVGIVMGSDSDLPVMEKAAEILKKFDVP